MKKIFLNSKCFLFFVSLFVFNDHHTSSFKRKLFTTLILSLIMTCAFGQTTFSANGVNYKTVSASTVKVISGGSYTGAVEIPGTVSYSNVNYTVKSIDSNAFKSCIGLTAVGISDSITSIGEQAFLGCTGLNSIKLPASITTIGNGAFWGCTGLTSCYIPLSVTSMGSSAFYGCSGLTSVELASNVTAIGNATFYGCSGLKSVDISESVKYIGDQVFQGCSSLGAIKIYSVLTIGYAAFRDCLALTAIGLASNLTSIGICAFEGCSKLNPIYLPSTVTFIGSLAFSGCTSLSSLYVDNLNNNYSSIDQVLFNKTKTILISCLVTKTGSYTIPSSVTTIKDRAFLECNGLVSVVIPPSVISIEDGAFADCTELTSITLPETLKSFGQSVFIRTKWYSQQPDGLIYIGKYLYNNKGTMPPRAKINLTGGTIGVAKAALCDTATIPALLSLDIPSSVTFIEAFTFNGCLNLESITSHAIIPPTLGVGSFYYAKNSTPLYVPVESVKSYKNAAEWNGFKDIRGIITNDVQNPENVSYSIKVNNRKVQLSNVIGKSISIYDVSGIKLFEKTNSQDAEEFTLANKGIYVIAIGNYKAKILVL